ncbi:hypothetical protein CCP3SC15_4270002 [Gammaproteobacteria bacterium]
MTSRNFVFTHNNYTPAIEAYFKAITDVRFLGFAHEVGESGTPHLQGVIVFHKPQRITAVIKLLPKTHVERMKGSFTQAWTNYIASNSAKPVDVDLYQYGDPPAIRGANLSERYDEAWTAAITGDLDSIPKDIRLRYYGTLKLVAYEHASVPDAPDVTGTWIVGPSGSGKSRYVRDTYGDSAYDKRANKWWDGYRPDFHTTAFLDDLDPSHCWIAYDLNRWADRYAFTAETKGGMTKIRPARIVVTSRYTIDEVFALADSSTRISLSRRFPQIIDQRPDTPKFTAVTIPK